MNHAFRGDFGAAVAAQAYTDTMGRLIGDDSLVTCAAWATGWVHALRGDDDAAVESCQRALEQAHDHFNRSRALLVLGYAHVEGARPREAIPVLERALDAVVPAGIRPLQGLFMAFLADAYRQDGDVARARQRASQSLEITTAVEFPFGIGAAHRVLGRVHAASGEMTSAVAELRQRSTSSRPARRRSRRRARDSNWPSSRVFAPTPARRSRSSTKPGSCSTRWGCRRSPRGSIG